MSIEVTSPDTGWRLIAGDPGAPQDGACWLADERKTIAWESRSGVTYQPLTDTPPVWWRMTPE